MYYYELNNLPIKFDYGEFEFKEVQVGKIINIKFNKTFTNIPNVVVGQASYFTNTPEFTILKLYNVTKIGFSANVTSCTTTNYSPIFAWIAIGE